jgi:hypothetical protein
MFLLLLCLSFLNSTSLCQLGAATLPNRTAYDFDGNGISEAGTAKEVLNDESGFVAFGGSISSITAQISYTDDAGRSGSVSVSAAASNTVYPAVALTWQNQ